MSRASFVPTLLTALALLIFSPAWGQKVKVFPRADKILPVGIAYHPEQVPERFWDQDLANIAGLGCTFVQIGQDAWFKFEPSEGKYDFAWSDRLVDLAVRHNLKVVFRPPVATLPVWMVKAHPEYVVESYGGPDYRDGAFRPSVARQAYRNAATKLVLAMAKRYGDNTGVIGWFVETTKGLDFSDKLGADFRVYMNRVAKQSLDTLNQRWNTPIDGQYLSTWDQVGVPYVSNGLKNAASLDDFCQWQIQLQNEFLDAQMDVLHRFTVSQFVTPLVPVSPEFELIDPFQIRQADFISLSLNGQSKLGPFSSYLRSVPGRGGLADVDPKGAGPGQASDDHEGLHQQLWESYGQGAAFICLNSYGRLKAYVKADGQELTPTGNNLKETLIEIERMKGYRMLEAVLPYELNKHQTAITYAPGNPIANRAGAAGEDDALANYANIRGWGIPVVFYPAGQEVDPKVCPVWVVNGYHNLPYEEIPRWRKYVKAGGHLYLCSGAVRADQDLMPGRAGWADRLRPLLLTSIEPAPGSSFGSVELSDSIKAQDARTASTTKRLDEVDEEDEYARTQSPVEVLKPIKDSTGVLILGQARHGHQAAQPAVIKRKLGTGAIYYGANGSTLDILLRQEYGIPKAHKTYSNSTGIYWNEGLLFIFNQSSESTQAPPYVSRRIIGHGDKIASGDFAVYEMYK